MRRWTVEIEHKLKDRMVQKHLIDGSKSMVTIGSSRNADVRLLGDGVEGIHAYLERTGTTWSLIDAGSEAGTWIDNKPVQRHTLKDAITIQIGTHHLSLRLMEFERELFSSKLTDPKGSHQYHQIVVRKKGHLIGTHLVPAHQSFDFDYLTKQVNLTPPKGDKPVHQEIGEYVVTQRLVHSDVVKFEINNPRDLLKSPESRVAVFTLCGMLFLFLLLLIAMPKSNEAELVPPTIEQNRFTKMIYDSKLIKQKREEAKQRQKQMMARAPSGPKTDLAPGPAPAKGSTPKVVSQLKMEGLQAMLGKISARASKNAIKITGAGGVGAAGRAVAAINPGSLQGVATQAGNGASGYRVGGVGTVGAGGGSGLKGFGGLAGGGVGSATVGLLDEESEIEGGLDRDVIARVINAQLGEIRYCYERQLAADPDIYGKVVVRFSIDALGAVTTQRVGLTTLRSAIVEGCILRRVASWKFPKPKGGTTVLVTYPFLFKSTN